jgi:drug/metabolite transporter (DMT)-like permease
VTHKNLARVVAWMSGALLAFCTMALSIRGLAGVLNIFEILAIRNGAGLLILSMVALMRPELRAALRPTHMGLHALRNGIHYVAQYAWAMSITLLPLATAFALEFTAPAWTGVLAALILGERLTPSRIGAIALGFIGVVVVLRPGLEAVRPATFLMLGAAIGFALNTILTKKLTGDVNTFAILFWMNAIQLPLALLGADPWFLAKLTGPYVLPALGVALGGLASHLCLTNALRWGDATIVIPIDFLRIPLIAFIAAAVYGEPIDVFVFAGAGLIVAGVVWNLRAETRGR